MSSVRPSVRPSPLFKTKQMSSENNFHYWRGDCGSGRVDHWWHLSCVMLQLSIQKCLNQPGVLLLFIRFTEVLGNIPIIAPRNFGFRTDFWLSRHDDVTGLKISEVLDFRWRHKPQDLGKYLHQCLKTNMLKHIMIDSKHQILCIICKSGLHTLLFIFIYIKPAKGRIFEICTLRNVWSTLKLIVD